MASTESDKLPGPMIVTETYLRHSGGTKDYRVIRFEAPITLRAVVICEWGSVSGRARQRSVEKYALGPTAGSTKIRSKLKRGYNYYPNSAEAIVKVDCSSRGDLVAAYAAYMPLLTAGDESEEKQSPLEFLYNMKDDQSVEENDDDLIFDDEDDEPAPQLKTESLDDKVKKNSNWGAF